MALYEKGHYANTLDSRTSDYNEPHFRNVIKYSGTMAHIHRIQTRPTSGNIVNVVPKQSSFGNDASSGYEYGTSLPKPSQVLLNYGKDQMVKIIQDYL